MRAIQTVLLAGVFVALVANTWETYQLRRELMPIAGLSSGLVKLATGPVETPTEHDARLRRETRHTMHDAQVIADEAFKPTPKTVSRTTPKPARPDQQPPQ